MIIITGSETEQNHNETSSYKIWQEVRLNRNSNKTNLTKQEDRYKR